MFTRPEQSRFWLVIGFVVRRRAELTVITVGWLAARLPGRVSPDHLTILGLLAMALGGLWHGASWTFVIWGAYHGMFLAFERWCGKRTLYAWLPYSGRVAVTFVLVLFSWVLFRSSTFPHALSYLRSMFGAASSRAASLLLAAEIYTPYHLTILGLCAFFSFQRLEVYDWVAGLNWSRSMILVPLFVLAVMAMFTQTFNPFLYFQF
jgi:alginate O-acetyltransferase complex protein AlgI